MKVREIIERIQALYSKGVRSQSSRLSNRHIYNKLITVRSRLISQELSKKQKISSYNYQTINCLELVKANLTECPCLPSIGCEMLRSRYKLPKPLTGLNGHIINYVGSLDGSLKIDEVNLNQLKYLKGNKYSGTKINYFLHNGYLFLNTNTRIKAITITGLFENLQEVNQFPTLCDNNNISVCTDILDTEFPIEMDKIDTLVEMSYSELLQIFSQMQEDNKADGRDEKEASKEQQLKQLQQYYNQTRNR